MMRAQATKGRILDAAERLFAERGFDRTSLRAITSQAGVNLAAVNYHFGTKDELMHAVFARRLAPLNARRLAMLDACEAEAGDGPPAVEGVVRAFVEPIVLVGSAAGLPGLPGLLGRLYSDPSPRVQGIFLSELGETARRFSAAMQRALPTIPAAEVYWRMGFSIGAMAHTLAASWIVEQLSGGLCNPSDRDRTLQHLIAFITAGLNAPVPEVRTGRTSRSARPVLAGRAPRRREKP